MSSSVLRVLSRLSAASRASSRTLARSSFQTPRRYMSASAEGGHGAQHSSDLPWQVRTHASSPTYHEAKSDPGPFDTYSLAVDLLL